ncbi:MAG: TrmO family methyltransferase [Desulfobacter sp.]
MSFQIRISPVGRVRLDAGNISLLIDKPYRKALTALEGFSHIHVLWWAHKTGTEHFAPTIADAPYQNGPEQVGIFATRSEIRPNPVLMTPAAVLDLNTGKGIVRLAWIDAEHDSPIIDIKPYQPCFDRVKHAQVPGWCADWPQWQEESGTFDWAGVLNV